MSVSSFFFLIEIQPFLLSLHTKVDDRSCRIVRCGLYAIPLPLNVIQFLRNVIIFCYRHVTCNAWLDCHVTYIHSSEVG